MKDDQRITLTKRLLKEGLLRLLKVTELDKISVTRLCAESGVNRATFYRHYEQPRDILNDLRREMFLAVAGLAEKNGPDLDIKQWLEDTCTYFYDNAELLKVLFQYRTDDEFVVFLNDLYKVKISELKKDSDFEGFDNDMMKLGTYYFAGGIYYILRQWLCEPINKTPKEVALVICRFLNVPTWTIQAESR